MFKEEFDNNIDTVIKNTKDLLAILDINHSLAQYIFLTILGKFKNNKNMTQTELKYQIEIFLLPMYENVISLLGTTLRNIDENRH